MAVLDALQWLGETLDKPGAAVRGLMAGRPGQLANLIPFSDTLGITNPRERVTGRDILEQWGLLGENTPGLDWGDVAGFGTEVAVDPLNWLGGGLLRHAGKVRAENAASQAMRASGAMPAEIAALTKAVDESGNPIRMLHGTREPFDKFDASRMDPYALYGKGIYTTDNPEVAAGYAGLADLAPGKIVEGSNIRQQFLDARNPLMIDDTYRLDELMPRFPAHYQDKLVGRAEGIARQATNQKRYEEADRIYEELAERAQEVNRAKRADVIKAHRVSPELEDLFLERVGPSAQIYKNTLNYIFDPKTSVSQSYFNDALEGLKRFMGEEPAERLFRELGSNKGFFSDVDPSALTNIQRELIDAAARKKARRMVPETPVPTELPGQEVYEALSPDLPGFDSIFHTGGGIVGDVPHNVKIVRDPSQVYLPYVAPALRNQLPVRSIIAAMLGENALAPMGRG